MSDVVNAPSTAPTTESDARGTSSVSDAAFRETNREERRDAVTSVERSRLAELEQVVERGMQTFVDVGLALQEIRDSRLYRERHGTFEVYCRERWGFSRSHGYRLIRAAELAAVSPAGDIRSERQARGLLEPGSPYIGRRLAAIAFGLDEEKPPPRSVEAVWEHAGRKPPTLDEEIEAEENPEKKLAVCVRHMNELPQFQWEMAGRWLMAEALAETGKDRDVVCAAFERMAKLAAQRVAELARYPG